MKKIKSIVSPSTTEAFASDLSRLGFAEQAHILVAAENALASRGDAETDANLDDDMDDLIEDDSKSEDDDGEDGDGDDGDGDDGDDMDDVMEDSGIDSEDSDGNSDDDDDAGSETLALDPGIKYSEKDIKKLRRICRACLDEGKHVHAARDLLKAIKNYEASK